jgi:two-component system sensor histidine kinase RstB
MKQLFIYFYLGVVAVLFMAWYIHGIVLRARSEASREKVMSRAHGGGVRLIAADLSKAPRENRSAKLAEIRKRFTYPVEIVPLDSLTAAQQKRLIDTEDVVCFFPDTGPGKERIAKRFTNNEALILGPLPDYSLRSIEEGIAGWMRLSAEELDRGSPTDQTLARLQTNFDYPLEILTLDELPEEPKSRLERGDKVVFYSPGNDRFYSVTPLSGANRVLRFGPFPNFERNEQGAAATTLALVLLPAAAAIALLLWPVSGQLRQVENAAKAIAAGDLSARVDVGSIRSAKPLAVAFNLMAARTESLVRMQMELLQAVSHELRTPLARIRFAIELIETAKDETERSLRLMALDDAAMDLDGLVEELLRYVKMETAETVIHKEPIDLKEVMESVVAKQAMIHPNIEFSIQRCKPVGDKAVLADRQGLQRALGNLLGNAGRYAKSRVVLRSEEIEEATVIDVDDDGPGIPEEDRERVFEPFVQLGDRIRENNKGVGLGLALVKRIVTQHGGWVELASSPIGGLKARTIWPKGPAPSTQIPL